MWSLIAILTLATVDQSLKNQILTDDFESNTVAWIPETGDAVRTVQSHERIRTSAHGGALSERIEFSVSSGSHLHYGYTTPRALVMDELQASVWVRGERPGIQLLARVTFPRERNPETLQLLGVVVAGSRYSDAGRWQRLELTQIQAAMDRQVQLLRAALRRNIDTRDAFVERLLLNVYTGTGASTVQIDDLELGPIFGESSVETRAVLGQPAERTGPRVEVNQDRLVIDGVPRVVRMIHAPGIAPATLKEFGFNVLSLGWPLDTVRIESAVNHDLWLQPELPDLSGDSASAEDRVARVLSEFPFRDAVLDWYVGNSLETVDSEQVAQIARAVRSRTPRRPLSADLQGPIRRLSRDVDMFCIYRQPIGTAMSLQNYRDWITQQRYLARPGSYVWSWIQAGAAAPELVGQYPGTPPDPDQIRLLTYASIAAGARSIGFRADASLGQPGLGRQRLLAMGLLNLELQLLEPFLAPGGSMNVVKMSRDDDQDKETIVRFGASRRENKLYREMAARGSRAGRAHAENEVEAAVLRNDRGVIVMPVWYGSGSQFVAGQAAMSELSLVVEGVSETAQAWQITPVDVRLVDAERQAGGVRIKLPEFDLSGIVLLTSDLRVLDDVRREVAKTRPWAAVWAAELAASKLESVREIDQQLVAMGHALPDGPELAQAAQRHLQLSRTALERAQYDRTYAEAQRSIRALRTIQRAHWEAAVAQLDVAQASPYAVAFRTLPEHWEFMNEVARGTFNTELVAAGDFESAESVQESGWTQQYRGTDAIQFLTSISSREPRSGRYDLHLSNKIVAGADAGAATDPAIGSLTTQPVSLQAGDIVRIRFALRVPEALQPGTDGVMLFDSIGGPALALTRTARLEWKQFELYRRATKPTSFTITIALSGAGDVHIDDLSIQRLARSVDVTRKPSTGTTKR